MKIILIYLLLVAAIAAQGQVKNVSINNHTFQIKNITEENPAGYDSINTIELYRAKKKILTHTLSNITGECNCVAAELGTYETTDSTIIFYSYWARAGDAPVLPYGVRKQIYKVALNGNLILQKAEIYVETCQPGRTENKGIKYLFTKPKNDLERSQLIQYLKETEQEYSATFVFGAMAGLLFKQVRAKLKAQIKATTKDWKRIFSTGFGSQI